MAGLKYEIGADVKGFQQGVNQVTQGFTKLEQASGKAFQNVARNADRGALALNSVSQVARDLPFGFIAIQNNLPIVFDQFGALIKQSGGFVGALKSVGAALAGPAGITFAIGAVIAGSTALIQKYGSLGAALTELSASQDAVAVRQRALNTAFVEAQANAQGEINKLNSLVGIIGDVNASNTQRANAYAELKKEYPGVLDGMTKENALAESGVFVINQRTKALITYIQLKAKEAALIKLGAEATEKELNASKSAIDLIENQSTFLNRLQNFFIGGGNASLGFTRRINELGRSFEKGSSDSDFFAKSLNNLQKEIQAIDRGVFAPEKAKEPKATKVPKLGGKVEVSAPIVSIKPERVELDQQAVNDALVNKQFTKENGIGINIPINLTIPPTVRKEFAAFADTELSKLQNKLDLVKQFSEQVSAQLAASFGNVLSTIGESVGNILSGVGNGFNAAGAVLSSIADILISVGKLAIQTGVAILGIKKALQSLNPALAIAGGIALVALGTAVKGKLANSVPKFANGGIVTRPTAGVFGEAGPEAIMPLDRLNQMIGNMGGSGNVQVEGEFILRGDNLYASVQRTGKRQGRSY